MYCTHTVYTHKVYAQFSVSILFVIVHICVCVPDVGLISVRDSRFESSSMVWGGVERVWFEHGITSISEDLTNAFFLLKLAFRASCLKFSLFFET